MNVLRKRFLSLTFVLIAGLTFLNMSFFVVEISVLKNAYNSCVLENIARMISTSFAEEDHDVAETSEASAAFKEIDFFQDHIYHLQVEEARLENQLRSNAISSRTHQGYLQVETPPPDLMSNA